MVFKLIPNNFQSFNYTNRKSYCLLRIRFNSLGKKVNPKNKKLPLCIFSTFITYDFSKLSNQSNIVDSRF